MVANVYDGQGKIYDPVLSGILADGRQVYPDIHDGGKVHTSDGEMVPIRSRLPAGVVVIASNPCNEYLYLPSHDPELARKIVRFLQQREEFGAIFVDDVYEIPGTVKLSAVRLKDAEQRHPDIVVAYNDDPEAVLQGVKGTTYTGMWVRRGDHGTPGRVNVRNTLIAAGPHFKSGLRSEIPSGNIDVAPTIAHLLGFELAGTDGRVLHEALRITNVSVRAFPSTTTLSSAADPVTVYQPTARRNRDARVSLERATYRIAVTRSVVTDSRGRMVEYLDDVRAIRRA